MVQISVARPINAIRAAIPMTDVLRRIVVRGRVQGVGYRAFVADIAATYGLAGWVRNRRDGAVEAVLMGSPDNVAAVIEECHSGPLHARVIGIETSEADPSVLDLRHGGQRFSVLPTV
jgi:acylphosphatase